MSEVKVNKISPRSGTDVTLGDSGDTFTIPSGATLTNSGTATGFGKVLQVVYQKYTTEESTTTASFIATGLTKSITPTSSSSEIIVSVTTGFSNDGSNPPGIIMYRGGSPASNLIGVGATGNRTNYTAWQFGNSQYLTGSLSFLMVDSPATTSATTYTLYWRNYSGTTYMNRSYNTTDDWYLGNSPSFMTLIEVAT